MMRTLNASRTRLRVLAPTTALAVGFSLICAGFTLTADPLDQWYRRNPLPTADRLSGVAYGNNAFVAVGFGGAIASSADGTNWVSQTSGTPEALYGVAYGNGTFVAVGGYGVILASDGLNWTSVDSGSDTLLTAAAYGNGTFVAVGDVDAFGNATILTSSEGVTWTPADSGMPGLLTAI